MTLWVSFVVAGQLHVYTGQTFLPPPKSWLLNIFYSLNISKDNLDINVNIYVYYRKLKEMGKKYAVCFLF